MPSATEIAGLNALGWGGYAIAALIALPFVLRRIFYSESAATANSKGAVDTIHRLYDLLDVERKYAASLHVQLKEANTRTDEANREKNAVIREIGEIKAQLAALQAEIRMLREEQGTNAD